MEKEEEEEKLFGRREDGKESAAPAEEDEEQPRSGLSLPERPRGERRSAARGGRRRRGGAGRPGPGSESCGGRRRRFPPDPRVPGGGGRPVGPGAEVWPSATMEPKHKELLAQCRQSLAQAMTEVDKVVELLEAAGALGPRDLRDLEAAGGGKAELLIALLLAKERDHFQDLRVALEKTQPHLLSILYLNGVAGAPAAAEETAGERGGGRGAAAAEGGRRGAAAPAQPRRAGSGRAARAPRAAFLGAERDERGGPGSAAARRLFRGKRGCRARVRALGVCFLLPFSSGQRAAACSPKYGGCYASSRFIRAASRSPPDPGRLRRWDGPEPSLGIRPGRRFAGPATALLGESSGRRVLSPRISVVTPFLPMNVGLFGAVLL